MTTAEAVRSPRCSRLIVDTRSGEQAAGEHAGGGRRAVRGGDHDEVVGVVLDPDVGDVAAETGRQVHRRQLGRLPRSPSFAGEAGGERGEDVAERLDLLGGETVDDVAAHALDVGRRGRLELLPPGVGEMGEHHPPVDRASPAARR